jgi:hypothetical protein
MALIKFVRNYNDLSTESGFQFEFFCDRCGSGYQTEFEATLTGTITDVLDTASNLFGGFFTSAASLGEKARSASWEKAHDAAFQNAVAELKLHFKQCKSCSHWVDNVCWNQERGLCRDCVPDLESEYSIAQTRAAIEQAQEAAKTVNYVTEDKFKSPIVATCASCQADVKGAKFCPECGTPVKRETNCRACGTNTNNAKFCPECGIQQ